MDDDLYYCSHRHKRSHAEMDHEGPSSPTWGFGDRVPASQHNSPSHPQVSGLHLPRIEGMQSVQQPQRYPGDGFDFRRPVSLSSSRNDVIDLTAEDTGPSGPPLPSNRPQRPPRFGREIIDVDEDEPPSAAAPGSPEIQFISARRIDPPRRPTHSPSVQLGPLSDDIEIVSVHNVPAERRRREHQHHNHGYRPGRFELLGMFEGEGRLAHLRDQITRMAQNRPEPVAPPRTGGAAAARRMRGHVHVGFITPEMDFEMVGFDLGMGPPAPPQPPPTYNAPEAALEGYTRSPGEDDVLVCPNCGDELCTGDSDAKKQVWIVRQCGHVYCGECTANRFNKRTSKGKERAAPPRTNPFKSCVVHGCDKKTTTRNAMIQVFL
ncbi:hypothetical protein CC78DRAFT_529425 [Lojkania enalia]|uniref:RING-type domain-containing protein n=1 Tax=Lojkania enalia TaxID=147567 RepID=A0A9P4N9N6_9PLEO|nr:hypothetical protein CC78DRAFT_529425 [Didymosphaeria enalia]